MRIMIHYLFTVSVFTLYGSQVCPFLETMSTAALGATLLLSFASAWVLRVFFQNRFILGVPGPKQAGRQFFLDMILVAGAGCVAGIINSILYDFPLFKSGGKILMGSSMIGFFIALDMALARQRTVIQSAAEPNFFPDEPVRPYSTIRNFSLVAVISTAFVSVALILLVSRDFVWLAEIGQTEGSLSEAHLAVMFEVFFIMAVIFGLVMNLIFSYSRNLRLLFENETSILERVSQGDLSRMVPVATNDEFGVIARHTNAMIRGLKHRIRLLGALKVAEELQQNLLPFDAPAHSGLDISGRVVYCYETGGDYYDYFDLPEGKLGIVVADAAEHGIGSALFMTAARAFILSALGDYRGPAHLVEQVNRHLSRDSKETGRFITLFFLEIDTSSRTLCWVRAGHDPAFMYDPVADTFSEVAGKGMALGVSAATGFQEYRRQGWTPGSVLVILTDGVREVRNPAGVMFGIDPVYQEVRRHAAQSAEAIRNKIFESLLDFQKNVTQADDVTLVVIKLL